MSAPLRYILEDLLKVRRLREDEAAKDLARQKEALVKAEQDLEQRRQELVEYKQWRVRRENELFDEIINQQIYSKDLEELRLRIQKLRDDESEYLSRVVEADKQLELQREKLEEARELFSEAYRERDKLDEHKQIWLEEAQREQEAREEKETEDLQNDGGLLAMGGV